MYLSTHSSLWHGWLFPPPWHTIFTWPLGRALSLPSELTFWFCVYFAISFCSLKISMREYTFHHPVRHRMRVVDLMHAHGLLSKCWWLTHFHLKIGLFYRIPYSSRNIDVTTSVSIRHLRFNRTRPNSIFLPFMASPSFITISVNGSCNLPCSVLKPQTHFNLFF